MKTAMQELIIELQKMYYDESYPSAAKEGIRIAIDTAGHQLNSIEKEKQQIIDAFEPRTDFGKRYESGEQYYNQTYNGQ